MRFFPLAGESLALYFYRFRLNQHKMDSERVSFLIDKGKKATDTFFSEEPLHIKSPTQSARVCTGLDEMYATIAENIDRPMGAVLFVDRETKWAYDLFPTLLEWRRRK